MATPEKAILQASVNGGAPQRGVVLVAHGDVVVFSPQNPAGVSRAEYRLREYPEGFECPAGWTELPGGHGYYVITKNGAPAPPVTMPAGHDLWGKYFPTLEVNDRKRNGVVVPELFDDATVLKIPSASGIEDSGFLEEAQFDPVRHWTGDYKRSLRTINNLLSVPFREIAGTTHTLELADGSKELRSTNGSETTVTVPPQADVPWPVGSRVAFLQVGAGQLVVAPGDGVAIHVADGLEPRIRGQYLPAILANIAEDEWVLYGALESTP